MREERCDIRFEALSVGYGDTAVLSDIHAVLPAGGISVILGGSGCGKSTLLRHMAGLARPLAGKVHIGGQNFFDLPSKEFRRLRRRMSMLFQDGALLGALTLLENTALPLREHTRLPDAVIRAAAEHCLALVGLRGFGTYFPAQLSGGMRKRAGLARALVTEPRILLCDEPTSGLDPINAARMDQLLLALRARYPDMTLVVVSHDLAGLKHIADHILVLRDGALIFEGGYAALSASENPYLQNFLRRESPEEADGSAHMPGAVSPEIRAAVRKWLDD
jgi:phospholipid/cholesterol/gamma-HCH transport system ATP-binding protein